MAEALVEGRDYYVEAGRWVFTEHFLRRRGYCCESGCRHCPYGFKRTDPHAGEAARAPGPGGAPPGL
jgi:hypothetical protein